jgi:hypothetical protein
MMLKVKFLLGSTCQVLPICPRQANCSSAKMTVPSIGLLFDICSLAKLLVESTEGRCIRNLPVKKVLCTLSSKI